MADIMKCPYCDTRCEAEYVDIGVGSARCTPWGCPNCHAVELHPDHGRAHSMHEVRTGWHEPQRYIKLPIATAPKDGVTIILLGDSGYVAPHDVYARTGYWQAVPGLLDDGYWSEETGDMLVETHPHKPAHWMILPC